MSFEYRYFVGGGQPRSITEEGVTEFKKQITRAEHEYVAQTGKAPTHLILGREERGKWDGMGWLYRSQRQIHHDPKLIGKKSEFRGMTVLWSSLESCLMVAEQEGS